MDPKEIAEIVEDVRGAAVANLTNRLLGRYGYAHSEAIENIVDHYFGHGNIGLTDVREENIAKILGLP